MNFKTKYMVKNYFLRVIYWFFGATSLLTAYTYIKWQKVIYYNHWMYENIDLNVAAHVKWVVDNELSINGVSIYRCFLIAIIADLALRKIFIKSQT